MYVMYAYIGVVLGVDVGIYGIHGVSGKAETKRLKTHRCRRIRQSASIFQPVCRRVIRLGAGVDHKRVRMVSLLSDRV